jgi:hypothetical protein
MLPSSSSPRSSPAWAWAWRGLNGGYGHMHDADREEVKLALAERAAVATRRAMLEDIDIKDIIAFLRSRGLFVVRDRLPVVYPPLAGDE